MCSAATLMPQVGHNLGQLGFAVKASASMPLGRLAKNFEESAVHIRWPYLG